MVRVFFLTSFLLTYLSVYNFSLAQAEDSSKIVFQNLSWAPDGETIGFSVIKVKSDWSDYSANNWTVLTYNPETQLLKKISSASLFFSFSPDGNRIAYDFRKNNDSDIYVYDKKTHKRTKLIPGDAKDAGPSWSPDGKFIAFYSDRDGNEEIYVFSLEDNHMTQVTNNEEHKSYNPAWSPSSDQIVYYFEKGDGKDQIYITDATGSYHTNLTADDHHNIFPSWTAQDKIVYVRDKGEVVLMEKDGSNKQVISSKSDGQARLSPDGKSLLLTDSGRIYTLDLETGKEVTILHMNDIFK